MRKVVDVELLKARLSEACGQSDGNLLDKAMDYVLHEYIPKLIDELAEEVDDNSDILDTNYKDPMVNKIKELDFGEEFEMKVHNTWSKYKIVQSELSEEEIDIIVIGEPNVCYAIGYSNMKDLKRCLIEDYWHGIITNIRTED